MSVSFRTGQVLLTLLGVLCSLIAVSVFFVPDPFEPDAQALIGTFGAGMGVLVIALATVGLGSRQAWPWLVLWALPAFFISHVVLLGTIAPDAGFAMVAAVALFLTRPRREPAGLATA